MPDSCIHGFDPSACLICRTLATAPQPTVAVEPPKNRRGHRTAQASAGATPPTVRPDTVYPPPQTRRRNRSFARSLTFALIVLLAVAAAIWVLAGVVFTVLHLLELIIVAAGAGWVGYRIGHFNGSRQTRSDK